MPLAVGPAMSSSGGLDEGMRIATLIAAGRLDDKLIDRALGLLRELDPKAAFLRWIDEGDAAIDRAIRGPGESDEGFVRHAAGQRRRAEIIRNADDLVGIGARIAGSGAGLTRAQACADPDGLTGGERVARDKGRPGVRGQRLQPAGVVTAAGARDGDASQLRGPQRREAHLR